MRLPFLSLTNRKQELHPTRNFYIRRFFRIAPLFYLSTGLTLLLVPLAAGPPLHIALSMLFLNGFGAYTVLHGAAGSWSIADEAIFYMILPLLYRWIRSLRDALYWLVIAGPICYFISYLLARNETPYLAEFFTFFSFIVEFPVFLLGIAAFFLWQEFDHFTNIDSRRRRLLSACLLLSLFMAFLAELPSNNYKLWAGSTLCATLLLALSLHPWQFLVNRVTIFLGKISFSIYLLHFYIVNRVHQFLPAVATAPLPLRFATVRVLLNFVLTLAITCPIATLSWLWIEEPEIKLGRRLIAYLEDRTRPTSRLGTPLEAVVSVPNSPDAQF